MPLYLACEHCHELQPVYICRTGQLRCATCDFTAALWLRREVSVDEWDEALRHPKSGQTNTDSDTRH